MDERAVLHVYVELAATDTDASSALEAILSDEQHEGATPVVVGIDGSPSSKVALRWAMRYAALTGGVVDAVIAWDYPNNYEWVPLIDGDALQDAATAALEKTVREVAGDDPSAKVITDVV